MKTEIEHAADRVAARREIITQAGPVDLEQALERLQSLAGEDQGRFAKWLELEKKSLRCEKHGVAMPLDVAATRHQFETVLKLEAVYRPCPECMEIDQATWLRNAGVPEDLLYASLDNWKVRTPDDQIILGHVRTFARGHKGFLILLGNIGNGKSHLAVAVMRARRCGIFRGIDELMLQVSNRYDNSKAVDIISKACRSRLLVLDDMGVGTGRRDEWPTIHHILACRHANYLPTVLTSNLPAPAFKELLGDRLGDRLKQSAFQVLTLKGDSMRSQRRGTHEAKSSER